MAEFLSQFEKIASALLEAEQKTPTATQIPSTKLFDKLDLSLTEQGVDRKDMYKSLEELALQTPRTASRTFFNQLFGGRNTDAVLGELLAVLLNTSMYTYKAAGAMIGVEKEILNQVCNLVGWGPKSGGTMPPGGSMANFMALLMARDAYDPTTPDQGVSKSFTVYTSDESHYSTVKNAAFAGIGKEQVRKIRTQHTGQMDMEELAEVMTQDINDGFTPMLINLTAGTTVLGAFDPIRPAVEIAKQFNCWVHVDGAYCGAVLLSDKYQHLIDGIELVDSFSFNAHKMLSTPLSCSILVAKDEEYLNKSFSKEAAYLYQTDDDGFNPGKTSLQCGRRNDALKLWALWKHVGTRGLAKIVNHQFDLAEYARTYIRGNADYTLYSFDESVSICFNYKNIDPVALCTRLYEKNELMVGYGSSHGKTFIRLITVNAQNSTQEIDWFFQRLERFVEQHEADLVSFVND